MFQAQAVAPEIQAVARALGKREGVEEALRLVEGLPDKDALELLITGASYPLIQLPKWLATLLLALASLGIFALFLVDVFHLSRSPIVLGALTFLASLPMIVILLLFKSTQHRMATRNGDEAIARYATLIQQTDAVELLLDYSLRETTTKQTKLACWKALSRLLPRLSDAQANALPEESRTYLFYLVEETHPEYQLPKLSTEEKIHVLLILAARKDGRTRRLMERQLVRPALKAAAQSILDDWTS